MGSRQPDLASGVTSLARNFLLHAAITSETAAAVSEVRRRACVVEDRCSRRSTPPPRWRSRRLVQSRSLRETLRIGRESAAGHTAAFFVLGVPKPKWMRWRTYDRAVEKFDRYGRIFGSERIRARGKETQTRLIGNKLSLLFNGRIQVRQEISIYKPLAAGAHRRPRPARR